MTNDKPHIAFLGIGLMGAPMTRNLLNAGYPMTLWNRTASKCDPFASEAAVAASPAEAVACADVVIVMLENSEVVEQVLVAQGAVEALKSGTLVIDMSSIQPSVARRHGELVAEQEAGYVDAPVSGGVGGAKAGTLTFICGGEADAFERARPILDGMARNIFHAGPHGAGQIAKICNNMLLAILMSGTSEALALGVENGLDPAVLSEIMKQSSGGNWALNVYNPWPGVMEGVPASRNYEGGFLVDLMNKDLGLAFDNAVRNKAPIPMGSLARNLFALHANDGNGGLDFSIIHKIYYRK